MMFKRLCCRIQQNGDQTTAPDSDKDLSVEVPPNYDNNDDDNILEENPPCQKGVSN